MNFNWAKGIGFGIAIWLIMFAVVSAFVGFNIYQFVWAQVLVAVIIAAVAYAFAANAQPSDTGTALGYGILWAAIGIVLDGIISLQFNPHIFAQWEYWVGYAILFLIPSVALGVGKTSTHAI